MCPDPDWWGEHFFFYNLWQNINSLRDYLQILWTLLGPLFKLEAPSAWFKKKGPVMLYISCSTTVKQFLTILGISAQVSFWGRICNSLMRPLRNKMKCAFCQNFILIFCSIMHCKIFVVFEILEVKYFRFCPLKSPIM